MASTVLSADLAKYERLWTTELDDHALITLNYYGDVIYLIYNCRQKSVLVTKSRDLDNLIIDRMLANDARVVDDDLLQRCNANTG